MQPVLLTDRLILRPLTLDDAEGVQRQFPHWEVLRYLNALVPWPYPADGARTYLEQNALPAMVRGEEWQGQGLMSEVSLSQAPSHGTSGR